MSIKIALPGSTVADRSSLPDHLVTLV